MFKKLWKKFYVAFNPFLPWSEAIEADLRREEIAKAEPAYEVSTEKAKRDYEVSTEEARMAMEFIARINTWKGQNGRA
jgi:hypothetical protein